jgi:hypothetical protein
VVAHGAPPPIAPRVPDGGRTARCSRPPAPLRRRERWWRRVPHPPARPVAAPRLGRRLGRSAQAAALDGVEAELVAYDRVRRTVAVEYVQADTQRNADRLRETDDAVRRRHQDDMRAIAADPQRARAYIRRVSLLESVQRFGIGTPPAELELEEAG